LVLRRGGRKNKRETEEEGEDDAASQPKNGGEGGEKGPNALSVSLESDLKKKGREKGEALVVPGQLSEG